MSATTRARLRAAIIAIAPAVLLVGFFYHPYISLPTDPVAIAAAAASDTMRWGLAHLAISVGYGLVVLAIRSYLSEAGEERWSILALPFNVMGSTLFVVLTGMEIGLMAAAERRADVQAVQSALFPLFTPILFTGALSFALGVLGFAMGDRSQRGSEPASELARPRGTRRYGSCALRPSERVTLRDRRGWQRGAVAAGIRDVEASGGGTIRNAGATEADGLMAPAICGESWISTNLSDAPELAAALFTLVPGREILRGSGAKRRGTALRLGEWLRKPIWS